MKIRYFKLVFNDDESNGYSIWGLKRIRERCFYSSDSGIDAYDTWKNPKDEYDTPLLDMLEGSNSYKITEITEEEAFVEMI